MISMLKKSIMEARIGFVQINTHLIIFLLYKSSKISTRNLNSSNIAYFYYNYDLMTIRLLTTQKKGCKINKMQFT
jgi:hypothetical protein